MTTTIPADHIARAAELLRVPEGVVTAIAYTYEEAQGRHTADDRAEAARHLLWSVGDPRGYQPGNFTRRLLLAWDAADDTNSGRLSVGFPLIADAINVLSQEGTAGLARWAGVE